MKRLVLITIVLLGTIVPHAYASETEGTISASYIYGWGENLGWINYKPDNGGLTITDTAITGYAWSRQYGWINFSPTNSGQGVTNTSQGVLGGYAWVSGRGWLPMTGVTINSSGKFTGTAGSSTGLVGRITFDCDYCDVRTDWRPLSARATSSDSTPAPSGGSGGGGGFFNTPGNTGNNTTGIITPVPLPRVETPSGQYDGSNHVEAFNAPLIVEPHQSGTITRDFLSDAPGEIRAIVEIPRQAYTDELFIHIDSKALEASQDMNGQEVSIVGNVVFDIIARDSKGVPVRSFNKPLKITLTVPETLQGRSDIGVFWLNEKNNTWIPIPNVDFNKTQAVFYVDHLTRFAIMSTTNPTNTIMLAVYHGPWWVTILYVLIIPFIAGLTYLVYRYITRVTSKLFIDSPPR